MKELFFFAGVASVVFGVWQVYAPAAFIVAGLAAIWIVLAVERGSLRARAKAKQSSNDGAIE